LRNSIRIIRIFFLLIDNIAQITTQTAASSGIVNTTATIRTLISPAIEITIIRTPQNRALYTGNQTVDPGNILIKSDRRRKLDLELETSIGLELQTP
jgi:hypothetical protein